MAIQRGNTAKQVSKEQPQDETRPQITNRFSLPIRGIGTNLHSLNAVHEIVNDVVVEVNKRFNTEMSTGIIDPSLAGTGIGIVYIAERRVAPDSNKMLIVSLMMVEDTMYNPATTENIRVNGESIYYPRVVSDLITDQFNRAVETFIQDTNRDCSHVYIASTMVVPTTATTGIAKPASGNGYSNDTNRGIVSAIAISGATSVVLVGDRRVNALRWASRTIAEDFTAENTMAIRYDVSNREYHDIAGIPTRNDMAIEVGTLHRDAEATGAIGNSVVVHAYPELVYMGSSDNYMDRNIQAKVYRPSLVISDISPSQTTGYDFSTLFMAIYAGVLAISERAWQRVYYPVHGSVDRPVARDIGMLTTTIRDPATRTYMEPLDLRKSPMNERNVEEFLQTIIQSEPNLQIDIPRASPSSWLMAYLTACADTDNSIKMQDEKTPVDTDELKRMRLELMQELNVFTSGHFPADYSGPVLHSNQYRLLLGSASVKSTQGHDRNIDPREFDYHAMLTKIGNTDRDKVDEFDRTTYDDGSNTDIRKRVAIHDSLIRSIFTGAITYHGTAARFTFNNDFLITFVTACTKAGLTVLRMRDDSDQNAMTYRSPDMHNSLSTALLNFGPRGIVNRVVTTPMASYTDRPNTGAYR